MLDGTTRVAFDVIEKYTRAAQFKAGKALYTSCEWLDVRHEDVKMLTSCRILKKELYNAYARPIHIKYDLSITHTKHIAK